MGPRGETRRGRGYAKSRDNSVVLHVDFDGPTLTRMPPTATVDAVLSADASGQVLERQLTRNAVTGGWRVVVRLRRVDGGKPVELRAHLGRGDEVLSERRGLCPASRLSRMITDGRR